MKKIIPFSFLLMLYACGGNEATVAEESASEELTKTCTFDYDSEATLLTWTAFKHTNKAVVGGAFNAFVIEGFQPDEDIAKAMQAVIVKIETASTETNDAVRNGKIAESFFGTMQNPGKIEVSFISVEGNNAEGSLVAEIVMNGKSQQIPMTYTVENETDLKLKGSIDVLNWDAQKSLDKLNEVCLEQHIGADGQNKLWSEVDITVITKLKKVCE
ncbi:MAG: YceI family protein [Flavobacteriales bacterium]